nr:MAG TPA: hypothetical protein [Caudoviricetes sp.]
MLRRTIAFMGSPQTPRAYFGTINASKTHEKHTPCVLSIEKAPCGRMVLLFQITVIFNQMHTVSYEIHFVYVQKSFLFFFRNVGFGNKQTVIVLFGCLGQKIHISQCKKHISFSFQNLYNLFCNFARLIR